MLRGNRNAWRRGKMPTRENECRGMRTQQRLVRLVLASTIASFALGEFSGVLEMDFQNAEEIQAAFVQQHGFKNRTCNEYYSFDGGDAGVIASHFLDGFIEVMGTDTIRPMSMGNMRNVVVRKHLDHAARLANQVPSSRLTDRKAALIEQGKLETCAIIGNSGHLKATSYGANIDRFDLVARGNQAPTKGYEHYVGSKTTMRFLNEAMTYRYKNSLVWAMGDAFQSCLQDYYNRAMRGVRRFGGSRQRFQGQHPRSHAQLQRRKLLQQEKQVEGHTGGDRAWLSISSRLSQAMRDRKVPLSAAARARLAAQQARLQQQPLQMENVSPARPIRVPMPPLMLQKAQSSCKPVLHKYAMQLGKITDDTVKFEDWAFPLEQGVILTHISEFKLTPPYHRVMAAHFRTLRRDVKSALVNYPVSFLAEDIIKKWTDYLVCKGDLPQAGGTRPTTGFTMLLSLLPMCDKVVMYGFGPPSGNPPNGTDYHFFESMLSRSWQTTSSNVHNFRAEYLFIKSLARKGRLTICNNANSPECGLNDENLDAAEAAAASGT